MDIWGRIYKDYWSGRIAPHELERDDGRVEVFDSAANYFSSPRSAAEKELLGSLEGPVQDLAAGPGSYALYLEAEGLQVTAADFSPGALDVCRARGCGDVRPVDVRSFEEEPGSFGSIIVMGNTLGVHQTPEPFSDLFLALRQAVRPSGRLLFTMIDPLDTTDESHLAYHRRNLEKGLPPGLVRWRIRYDGMMDDWMNLWMLTDEELRTLASDAGWVLLEERRRGPFRIRLLESTVR